LTTKRFGAKKERAAAPPALTPYAVLLVKAADGDDKIRQAYHKIAQKHHPDAREDKQPGPQWYEATDAYNAVKTEAARAEWEARLKLAAKVCAKCKGVGVEGSRFGGGKVRPCAACAGTGRS
jgi:DnaJ-class molecular chaperone